MHQTEELRKFRWLFFLLVPAFAVSMNMLLFGEHYFSRVSLLFFSTLLLLVITLLLSSIQIFFFSWMRKRMGGDERLIKRILVSMMVAFPITALFVTLIFRGYDALSLFNYHFESAYYYWALFAGFVCDIIGIALNEGIYSYSKWKETKLEAEQLSKEKLQTQLNGLLQQINPHFLFNSLNSLSALIAEDPKRAQKFVSDLSKVYRYLLRTNESELTTLEEEIRFIDSYFHLLQTRFGTGVQLEKQLQVDAAQVFLPPLTLQLLIENAVKHNSVARSRPLVIQILADSEKLTVQNNLQKKTVKVESGKVGLTNIAEKYRLINKSSIVVREDEKSFSVTVPLLPSSPPA